MEVLYKLIGWFLCFTGDHDWTSAANEGMKPTQKQQDDGVLGYWDYAKMYCGRCGKLSDLNRG